MKIILIFCLLVCALVRADEEYYKTDGIEDINLLLGESFRMQVFLDCLLDKGPCSDLAFIYKRSMKEAIEQACKKCNDNQKYMFYRLVSEIKKSLPDQYQAFREHYDPENKYFDALEMEISKHTKPVSD